MDERTTDGEWRSTLRFRRHEGLARITLDRGDGLNAKNDEMGTEFRQLVTDLTLDRSVRCLLIDGAGRNFCAGGDLTLFVDEAGDVAARTHRRAESFHAAVAMLLDAPWPIVAAVHGGVIGGGLSFVVAADIVIADTTAHFRLPYVQYGLVPDGGITWWLQRLLGPRRTVELALLGRELSAEEACGLQLVNDVVSPEALAETAQEIGLRLSRLPGDGAGQTARLLRAGWAATLEEQLRRERLAVSRAVATDAAQQVLRQIGLTGSSSRLKKEDI